MILYQYLVIHASFVFFVVIKVLCNFFGKHKSLMHDKPLKSIAENNEEEEIVKWVPKKKHEILKAKYKCLKKLFQIYDASVIGILPETVLQDPLPEEVSRRRKRSYRTKTDASAGTTELSSGDVTQSENEATIATEVFKELKLNVSTPNIEKTKVECKDDKFTHGSKDNVSIIIEKNCEVMQHNVQAFPNQRNKKRKPTRFQSFIHRLLGLNTESLGYLQCDTKVYAASDNNISNIYEKRRRRGLRLRKLKRVKKIHSEIILGDTQSPMILSFVQTVQKSCLLDTTPRHCPIPGCKMMFYGIINYNDHLNLCHFPEKKFICHYCHDGFYTDHDKTVHENEHIGITKLSANTPIPVDARESIKITNTNDTQTEAVNCASNIDVPDEKLKKIVSFFEKINDPDDIIAEIKKSRFSESHLQKIKNSPPNESSETSTTKKSNKTSISLVSLKEKAPSKFLSIDSDVTSKTSCASIKCRMCGENFDYRRQLRLHVDMEHRIRNKFPKFHSCAGILNRTSESEENRFTAMTSSTDSECYNIKPKEVHREPSANIVYYTSTETIGKKPSVVNSFVQKVRTGFSYKWEPGTKIIRV